MIGQCRSRPPNIQPAFCFEHMQIILNQEFSRHMPISSAVQCQNAVTAYCSCEQLLLAGFAAQSYSAQ